MEPSAFESLLIQRLDSMEEKIDRVRSEDLPKVKTDVAVLIAENKASSKLHSTIGSLIAVVISAIMSHYGGKQ